MTTVEIIAELRSCAAQFVVASDSGRVFFTEAADQIETLQKDLGEAEREVAALAKWGDKHGIKGEHSVWETLDNMVARLQAAEEDARRMDWMCANCTGGQWEELNDERLAHKAGFLRQAIDAAMLKEKETR